MIAAAALVVVIAAIVVAAVIHGGSDKNKAPSSPSWLSFAHRSGDNITVGDPRTDYKGAKLIGWAANSPGVYSAGTDNSQPIKVPTSSYAISLRCKGSGQLTASLTRVNGDGYPAPSQRQTIHCGSTGKVKIVRFQAEDGKNEKQALAVTGPASASWLVIVESPAQ